MENKYLTYDVTDLATDDQFIQWGQTGRPSESPWAQWLLNYPEVLPKIDEAATLVLSLQYSEETIPTAQTDALWNRINTSIATEEEVIVVAMPRRNVFRLVAYAAAACLVFLLCSRLLLDNNETIYVGQGQSLAHVLPDASKIQLNADSKITYDQDLWEKERTLSLNGEAYFEVEKGQKFTVHTDNGDITVLGTSFNIYSRDDGFRVHCTSGKVQVTAGNEKVILTPDTRTSMINGKLSKETTTQNKVVDWLSKVYRFEGIPLKVVFAAVGRQFDVNITMDAGIGNRLYTGSFEAIDLQKALNAVCFPMEVTPIIQGKKIRIQSDDGN